MNNLFELSAAHRILHYFYFYVKTNFLYFTLKIDFYCALACEQQIKKSKSRRS